LAGAGASLNSSFPVVESRFSTPPLAPATYRNLPSGLKATCRETDQSDGARHNCSPVVASHTHTRQSTPRVATRFPSGEIPKPLTYSA
jgi:hypothetical protein